MAARAELHIPLVKRGAPAKSGYMLIVCYISH
ncbi:hypothetical protein M2351_001463 [Azospirillum canadense]|nr:hypothetical protein [Azospirillum canadense]